MSEFMYKDTVGRLAKLVQAEWSRMEAIYNFDYGEEFEIACCHIISTLLPARFGVCRGHIVTADNQEAGDDLIIFDRELTPTLRLLPSNDFSRKEFVPVESVYAYIEAKNKLKVFGKDENFSKALAQVEKAKKLPRQQREHSEVIRGLVLDVPVTPGEFSHPDRANPMLGVIVAHSFEFDDDSWQLLRCESGDPPVLPDLILAGPDRVALPVKIKNKDRGSLRVFRETADYLAVKHAKEKAFAIGLLALLNALHFIDLEMVNWRPVLLEQLDQLESE